ncbi:MAG: DUF1801 domain-containing protein [Ignavibacteriaceae bacterium]
MVVKTKFHTVDDYIQSFPKDVQNVLENIRRIIRETVPEAEERISYNMPAYNLNGYLVYFAGWKNHIGLYPISAAIEKKFSRELSKYKIGKGSIQFPFSEPMPVSLIKKIVKHRIKENLEKDVKQARIKNMPYSTP